MAAQAAGRPPGGVRARPRRRIGGALMVVLLLASHLVAVSAQTLFWKYVAVTVTTDSTGGAPPAGSLRAALEAASTDAAYNFYIYFNLTSGASIALLDPPPNVLPVGGRIVIDGALSGPSDRVKITTAGGARLTAQSSVLASTLSLLNLEVQGLTFKTSAANFEAHNCRFSGAGVDPGKAFYLKGAGVSLLVEDSSFEDFTNFVGTSEDAHGAAVLVKGGATSVVIRRTTFLRNRAENVTGITPAGGAACITDVQNEITLEQVTVADGYANVGGGVFIGQPAATAQTSIRNCTFRNNIAVGSNGGGLYAQNLGPLLIQGSTFVSNRAVTSAGGAIFINAAVPGAQILDSSFIGNTAAYRGGCVYMTGAANVTVQRSAFVGCSSVSWGGCLFADSSADGLTVDSCAFQACTSGDTGGGVFALGDNTAVTRTTFANCAALNKGGGLFAWRFPGMVLSNLTFAGCSADQGGCMHLSAVPGLVMSGVTFQGCNSTNKQGGGLFIERGWAAGPTSGADVSGLRFLNCRSFGDGGGAYFELGNSTLTDHTYTGCSAGGRGGGAFVSQAVGVTLAGVTASRCTAASSGGGVAISYGSGNAVLDSAFADNSAATVGGGLVLFSVADTVVSRVTLLRNGAPSGTGGGLYMNTITDARVTNVYTGYNRAGTFGGGFLCDTCTGLLTTNLTALGNTAGTGAGGYFTGGSKITIAASTLSNNTASAQGGGIYFINAQDVTISLTTFTDCTSPNTGGALRFQGSVNTLIDQCAFTRCSSFNTYGGGGAFFGQTSINTRVLRSTFQNCTAGEEGGGLSFYDDPRSALVSGCNFTGGTAGFYGGGLYVYFAANTNATQHVTVEDCDFTGNSANYGGGLLIHGCPDCVLQRLTLNNNFARSDGGGAWLAGARLQVADVRVAGNRAASFGGGILLGSGSVNAQISGMVAWGNTANHGGGLFIDGSNNATLTQSDFLNNTANVQGGGTILRGSTGLVVTSCTFLGNQARSTIGGGLWIQNCPAASVSSCTMAGNSAADCGGGLLMMLSPSSTFTDLMITNNTGAAGGGICNDGGASPNLLFESVTVTGNTASGVYPRGAGGVYLNSAASSVIRNSVVDSNSGAGSGGLVLQSCDGAAVVSSVFTNNAGVYGGGSAIRSSKQTRIAQSLFQGNKGAYGVAVYAEASNGSAWANVTLRGNTGTTSNSYGYISLTTTSNCAFDDLLVEDNRGVQAASLYSWGSPGNVHRRNIFRRNGALTAPGFFMDLQAQHTFIDSTFTDNTGQSMGSIVLNQGAKATLVRSLYARNGIGGTSGIAVFNGANLVVRESTLDSNGGSTSTDGSEIHVLDSSADVRSSTIAATAPASGAAIPFLVTRSGSSTRSAAVTSPGPPPPVAPESAEAPASVKAGLDRMAKTATSVLQTPPPSIGLPDDTSSATSDPGNTGSTGSGRRLLATPAEAAPSGASPSDGAAGWAPPALSVSDVASVAPWALAAELRSAAAGLAAAAATNAPGALSQPGDAAAAAPHPQPLLVSQAGQSAAIAGHAAAPPMPPPAEGPAPLAPVELPADAPTYERAALAASGRAFTVAASAAAAGPSPARPASRRRRLMAAGVKLGAAPAGIELAGVSGAGLAGSAIFLDGASGLNLANSIVGCPNSQCLSNAGTGAATVKFSLLRGAWGAPADGNIDSAVATTRLGPLQDNGGPTLTRMPDVGSPSIDAGSNALLLADGFDDFDQRGPGFPRLVCTTVDMGAVEAPARAPGLYPAAVPAIFNTTRNKNLTVDAPGVVANGGPFQQFTGTGMQAVLVTAPAAGGGVDLRPDGSFVYWPPRDFVGTDSFVVKAQRFCSGTPLDSPPAMFYVSVGSFNRPPTLAGFNLTADQDTPLRVPAPGLLTGASDPDGDAFGLAGYSQPGHGSVVVSPDGAFNYTPAPDFSGLDSFRFNVSDAFGASTVGVVFINVAFVVDVPVVLNQNYSTLQGAPLTVPAPGVLRGASDDGDPLTASLAGLGPAHGTVVLRSDGGFTYTPNPDFFGLDSFSYTASDGNGGYATATAFINVVYADKAPYAVVYGAPYTSGTPSITITAYRNAPLVITALGLLPSGQPSPPGTALFADPQNSTLALTMPRSPGLGSATFSHSLGVVTYKPPYMKKGDPDIMTSLVLQATNAFGLQSPPLTVNLVVGTKPPLGTPSIDALAVRLTGCTASGVNVDTFSVTSGSLTLLDATGAPVLPPAGAPTGLRVQAVPKGTPWPVEPAGKTKVPCIVKSPVKLADAASRTWDYGSCAPCLKCLTSMGFDCKGSATGPEWQVRVKAYAKDGAAWADSAWSAPFTFRPTCEGKALTCFPKTP